MTATMPLTDPTDFGNRPSEGPLRAGGVAMSSPVTDQDLPSTPSPVVQAQQKALQLVRDLEAGAERIRDQSTVYLPKEAGEHPENYRTRLARSVFHNFFGRTVEGLTGLVFRKDPVLGDDVPAVMRLQWENLDLAGTHGDVFVRDLFQDAGVAGHAAILVEYPKTDGAQGYGQELRGEIRPYWVPIRKDDIRSWRTTTEDGHLVLTQLVLRECQYVETGAYGEKEQTRWRVFRRARTGETVVVSWELLEVTPDKKVHTVDQGVCRNQVEIPVAEVITNGRTGLFASQPPLLDLAYLNVAHYQQWSDYATVLHMTIPLLFGAGVDGKDAQGQDLTISVNAAIWSTDPQAKLSYVYHDVSTLAEHKAALDALKSDMGALGLAMLAPQKRTAETAEAKRLDKATSDSALAVAARGLQDGIERALGFHARYLSLADGGSIAVNRDFEGILLDAPVMTAYATLVAAGFPRRAVLEVLKQGGRIPPDANLDELEMEWAAGSMADEERRREERERQEAEARAARGEMAA